MNTQETRRVNLRISKSLYEKIVPLVEKNKRTLSSQILMMTDTFIREVDSEQHEREFFDELRKQQEVEMADMLDEQKPVIVPPCSKKTLANKDLHDLVTKVVNEVPKTVINELLAEHRHQMLEILLGAIENQKHG